MKQIVIFALLLISIHSARSEDAPLPSRIDAITKAAKDLVPAVPSLSMPSVSMPTMPNISMPDFSIVGAGAMVEFNAFTKQVSDSLPILEEMGFEVSTFRVQWGLPPQMLSFGYDRRV